MNRITHDMTTWGAGIAIGFAIGGPIGASIGAGLGSAVRGDNPANIATSALMGYGLGALGGSMGLVGGQGLGALGSSAKAADISDGRKL